MKRLNPNGLAIVEAMLLSTLQEFLRMRDGSAKNLHVVRGLVPGVPGCAELIPNLAARHAGLRPTIQATVDGLRLVRAAMLARQVRDVYTPGVTERQEAAQLALDVLSGVAQGFIREGDVLVGPDYDGGHVRDGDVGILFELPRGRWLRILGENPDPLQGSLFGKEEKQ